MENQHVVFTAKRNNNSSSYSLYLLLIRKELKNISRNWFQVSWGRIKAAILPERYLSRGEVELWLPQQQKNKLQTRTVANTSTITQSSWARAGYAWAQSCSTSILRHFSSSLLCLLPLSSRLASVADVGGVRIRACAFSSLSRAALTTLPGISSSHSQGKTSLTHTHTHYWLMVGRSREMHPRRFKATMLVHLLGMRINTESMEIMNVNSCLEMCLDTWVTLIKKDLDGNWLHTTAKKRLRLVIAKTAEKSEVSSEKVSRIIFTL